MATAKTAKTIKEEKLEQISEEPLRYIDFEYNGTVYTLEFNRRTIEYLEKNLNMSIAKTLKGELNVSDIPNMFAAALMMHHPRMKMETVNTLYGLMADKEELLGALVELLANAINSIFEEPEEGKVISWTRH